MKDALSKGTRALSFPHAELIAIQLLTALRASSIDALRSVEREAPASPTLATIKVSPRSTNTFGPIV